MEQVFPFYCQYFALRTLLYFSNRPWLLTVSCIVEEVIKSDRFWIIRLGRPQKTNIWGSHYAELYKNRLGGGAGDCGQNRIKLAYYFSPQCQLFWSSIQVILLGGSDLYLSFFAFHLPHSAAPAITVAPILHNSFCNSITFFFVKYRHKEFDIQVDETSWE